MTPFGSLKWTHRFLCWAGFHKWIYSVFGTERFCLRCRKAQLNVRPRKEVKNG